MTFAAWPLAMSLTKYAILLVVIVGVVPALISWLERRDSIKPCTAGIEGEACAVPLNVADCTEPFWSVLREMARDYGKNVWMLVKPTITLMLIASVISSALLTI